MHRLDLDQAYVISDTHWYHDNIVKYCGRDKQIQELRGVTGPRVDKYTHNYYMIDRWNATVKPDDQILHLGDVFSWFGNGPERFENEVLPRLNGDIFLVLGNHDLEEQWYTQRGIVVLDPFVAKVGGRTVSFNHYPFEPGTHHGKEIRIHGHIHNNGYPKTSNWKDGTDPWLPNQINVSVEVVDYTPQRITHLVSKARS
jgi:calcineurin-like phosphoesterase family protein